MTMASLDHDFLFMNGRDIGMYSPRSFNFFKPDMTEKIQIIGSGHH